MASVSAPAQGTPEHSGVIDKGLKKNAIGYLSNLVIGVASTAPAYSLAATLGAIVAIGGLGVHAPGVLLIAFVPMLLIAGAYKYLNRADPDAGTTFAWTTRAFGPGTGWINGWAIFLADVIVMASLAKIAATYTFKLFGFTELGESNTAIIIAAVVWIALMTWICWRGIELSARIQQVLLSAEILVLGVFATVALVKVYGGSAPHGSIKPTLEWFNPFGWGIGALMDGVLLAVFIYWGWDSGVAVNEESEDPREGPGRAAVLSTILLLFIYVIVSTSAQAYHGTVFLSEHKEDVLNALGSGVLGGTLNKLLIISVLTSASASTQTTILPTARTTLSMAHWKAVAALLGRVHKRYLTPDVSTLGMGAISILVTVGLLLLSESVQADAITAIGFPICFYYGFTGFACAWYYRNEIFKSLKNFFFVGLAPTLGGAMLFFVGIDAAIHYGHKANVESKPIGPFTLPVLMGVGGLVLGVILMIISRLYFREYFARKTETAPPGILELPVEHTPAHF